jgi:hypothetical protein
MTVAAPRPQSASWPPCGTGRAPRRASPAPSRHSARWPGLLLDALDAAGREDDADDADGFLVSGDASPSGARLDGRFVHMRTGGMAAPETVGGIG